ncbi:hypothetical protein [Pararobbsia silviterrae]|uniref:Uncharacterized protein n=1 Tax=Pararobbsia silviterrae TaxID=1792498 RepID=A0A494YG92_9BURK|nr:hypothetical protein [Pararobbsia silviterrae]RKP59057.1 hypothetical protein D7S86_03855 [Pararobbsia silviterrae]
MSARARRPEPDTAHGIVRAQASGIAVNAITCARRTPCAADRLAGTPDTGRLAGTPFIYEQESS